VRTPEIVAVGAALLAARGRPEPGLLADWKPEASVVAPVPDWIPRYRTLSREFTRVAPTVHPGAGPHVYP
jgi:xylulokinase